MNFRDSRVSFRHGVGAAVLGFVYVCLFLLTFPDFAFSAAIVVKGNLNFNGSGILVDSFDSSNPALSTGGQYDPTKAGDGGDIYVGQTFSNSANIGNSLVYGTLFSGPGVPFLIGPSGAVGTHSWINSVGSGIEPGFLIITNFVLTDVTAPNAGSFPTPIAGTAVTQSGPATNETFLNQTNLPILGRGQSIISITTNTTMVTTAIYPGPLPGLTTNLTFVTTETYPGDVPSLTTNCIAFVTVTNDPGPQPCLSSVDVVTNITFDYPGPIPGLVTNTFITPPCITTNFVCSDPITSSTPPESWCDVNGIQTNCGAVITTTLPPASGSWCLSEGITTNLLHGIKPISYTYYPTVDYTYTTNVLEYITYTTNDDCPSSTNYTYTYVTGNFTYANQIDYTYQVFTYTYPQLSYDYTIYFPWTYQTNYYDDVLAGGNYFATSLGNTIVTGPSVLVVPGGFPIGNLAIAPGGSLIVYVQSGFCSININQVTNVTGLASNLLILCSPGVTAVTLSGTGSFVGVVDAPEANASLAAGGNSQIDFSGTLVVNSLTVNGHYGFHYDEALGQVGYLLFPAAPTSPNLLPNVSANGLFQFYVQGTPGDNCAVETSTDLVNWVPVFTNVAPFIFTDTNGMGLSQNFYRTIYVQ